MNVAHGMIRHYTYSRGKKIELVKAEAPDLSLTLPRSRPSSLLPSPHPLSHSKLMEPCQNKAKEVVRDVLLEEEILKLE